MFSGGLIIKRLQVCIEIKKSSNNKNYKQFLNDFIYDYLEKSIEKVMGDIDITTDDVITITTPQVINIGKLSINKDCFYSQFTQKIYLAIYDRIQKIIESKSQERIQLVDYKKNSFVIYLQTGSMENDILHNEEDINILYDEILRNEAYVKDIFIKINRDSNSIKRFLGVISKENIQKTVKTLYTDNIAEIKNIIDDLVKIKKNIFIGYHSDEEIKKNACKYLLENYGNSIFDSGFFILNLIKILNNFSNIQYLEVVYNIYHKIKNVYRQNNIKIKDNIVIATIENLYKNNYEKISILPIYDIESEIKDIGFILRELQFNPTKKIKQKLIYKISDIVNSQFMLDVKIKIKDIVLQKIKKIDFEDCNIGEVIKIYANKLYSGYFIFYHIFSKNQSLLNKNTIDFILNNVPSDDEYICKIIDVMLSPRQEFCWAIKKELAQFKDEVSYEKIKNTINQFCHKQRGQYITSGEDFIGADSVLSSVLLHSFLRGKDDDSLICCVSSVNFYGDDIIGRENIDYDEVGSCDRIECTNDDACKDDMSSTPIKTPSEDDTALLAHNVCQRGDTSLQDDSHILYDTCLQGASYMQGDTCLHGDKIRQGTLVSGYDNDVNALETRITKGHTGDRVYNTQGSTWSQNGSIDNLKESIGAQDGSIYNTQWSTGSQDGSIDNLQESIGSQDGSIDNTKGSTVSQNGSIDNLQGSTVSQNGSIDNLQGSTVSQNGSIGNLQESIG
ncbi:MAG: hypothetical protein II393_01030, partial [Cytophagales bacterium]|nr:hypothetical protein [Cytophagales bacterium]